MTYLLAAYFEVVFCDHEKSANLISQHLYNLIFKDDKDGAIMSISQLCYLLHILSIKKVMSINEVSIRSHALQCLRQKLDVLKIKELVDLAVSLSKM